MKDNTQANKEIKEALFIEHLEQIELAFQQAAPEMASRLGAMDRPQDNGYAVFELPLDIIPDWDLTIACSGNWDTRTIAITHYKLEPKHEA